MPLVETTVMDIQILSKIFFIFMSIEKFAFIVFILFAGRDIQIKNYITKHNSKYCSKNERISCYTKTMLRAY